MFYVRHNVTLYLVYFTMVSEPAKFVGLTTGILIDAYFEEPCIWDANMQIHPHSVISFRTAFG